MSLKTSDVAELWDLMSHHLDSLPKRPFRVLISGLEHIARRHGVPHPDYEDCAQQVLLALLIAHPDWSIEAPSPRAVAWIRGAARLVALDYHRQRRRHPSVSLGELGWVLPDKLSLLSNREAERGGTEPGIDAKATACDVLKTLSEMNRRIIIRRVRECQTFSEIAEDVGLTREQVKSRYQRAMKSLRRLYREWSNVASSDEGGGQE